MRAGVRSAIFPCSTAFLGSAVRLWCQGEGWGWGWGPPPEHHRAGQGLGQPMGESHCHRLRALHRQLSRGETLVTAARSAHTTVEQQ